MRTARTLFASAAVTAVLAITTPAAQAITVVGDDGGYGRGHDHGRDHDKGRDHGRDHDKGRDHGRDNGRDGQKPSGGMRTGGGALTNDWGDDDFGLGGHGHGRDHDKGRDHGHGHGRDHGRDHGSDGQKPSGGVRTGGGAMAKVVNEDWGGGDGGGYGGGGGRDHGRDHGRDGGRDHGRDGGRDHGRDGGRDHGRDGGGWGHGRDHDHGRDNGRDGQKPSGGVHTGGGGMALSGSSLAAGSVLMLGGLGAGVYVLRRRNASGTPAA
ncbi:hypothetical protein [Streptomyces sp. NPDC048650]|uniref:hypothetical protein n=1 Tax=Streptomyces sp. NPDC048650 TaxID=3365583 RepID=UPI00371E9CFE